jgi:pimeloyl-ACP methyl ester carboxylesterase
VVFVHGFNGNPERTWLHKGDASSQSEASSEEYSDERHRKIQKVVDSFKVSRDRKAVYWPRDLLPQTLPYARVLTYGYDTHLGHRLGRPKSQNTVYDFAKDFLMELEAVRRSQPKRPLLFIAHSLGGIVVKEMLRQSYGYLKHQSALRALSESTSGIIFFGTPHGGADPRSLLKTIAENIARVVGFTVNEQVLESLLPSSERLRQLRDEFGPMAREQGWVIHCFQEDHGIKALNGRKVSISSR